jgi:hypothetical protein
LQGFLREAVALITGASGRPAAAGAERK